MLGNAMDEMDIDAADEMIESVCGYNLPDAVNEDVEELKTAVETLDDELAKEIIERLLEKLPK